MVRPRFAAGLLGLTVALCASPAWRAEAAVTATFGKTTVGAFTDGGMFANYKIVHAATLSVGGAVTRLNVYAVPGINSPSPQALRAVIYSDSGGSPGALLATGTEVLYRGDLDGSGWFELPFPSPVNLSPGAYWLGFITGNTTEGVGYVYDRVEGSRAYNIDSYPGGPTTPFGLPIMDSEQASIYATYVPARPVNASPPTVSGVAQQGQTLTASPGSWTNSPTQFVQRWQRCTSAGSCSWIAGAGGQTYVSQPGDVGDTIDVQVIAINAGGSTTSSSQATTPIAPLTPVSTSAPTILGTARLGRTLIASPGSWSGSPLAYGYQWSRCDGTGANCVPIIGASRPTYQVTEADVNGTLRVMVTAYSAAGASAPVLSAAREVSNRPNTQHLEYVLNDGRISVYDIDDGFALVKTISLPQLEAGVRGVSVAPSTHLMFISYGGDGGGNGSGSVLAYDVLAERALWSVHLSTGIDSGALSPDGTRLYEPTGENSSSGIWNVLDTSNGEVIGTIQGGSGAHNTIASADGRYVYLGGRNSNHLDVYETSTGHVSEIGPLVGGVRPFTVNGKNTVAFTTATEYDGFQVSSITTGKVLFSDSFAGIPSGFPFTTASHGISISPDEKQLYVLDAVNKAVQVWDVSRVAEDVGPSQLGVVPVAGLSGEESGCAYDCGRDGWVQLSIDGSYAFVGDSGDVIETATRKVIANLPTLANTRKSIEVEWAGGVPVATSTRLGVGKVR
jgi:hypothetical protein